MNYKYYWHCHHEYLIEKCYATMHHRQKYIREFKDGEEIPLRLLLFRGAKIKPGAETAAVEDYIWHQRVNTLLKKLHKKQCEPDCPWSFKHENIKTKFSEKKGRWVTKTGR